MLRMQIISAPKELRDQVRNLTRMQLIRTCAAWRPDTTDAADPITATRIALKSLARRILDLDDEIAMLDELIKPIVTNLAPQLLERPGNGVEVAGQLLVTAGDNPIGSAARQRSRCSAVSLPYPRRRARPSATASTAAVTGKPIARCTSRSSAGSASTPQHRPTSRNGPR